MFAFMRSGTRPLLLIAVLVAGIDQTAKWIVRRALPEHTSVPVLGDFFRLTHVHNTGAAFGILPSATVLFVLVSVAVCVFILTWGRRMLPGNRWLMWTFALELGGAVGNLIDRLRWGYVVDFLDFGFHQWRWPVFNLADTALTIGACMLVLHVALNTDADIRDEDAAGSHEPAESVSGEAAKHS